MIKSKFKRVTSLFLATLMCVTTFAGIGSTTAFAASGEKADVYMVDFPRDGDANYDGVWGHSNLTLKNGWHTGRSNFTNLKAIGSYSGNVAYCIEPGISLKVGQTMNKYDENYFNNLAANGVISGDEIRLFVGRILQYGYRGTISTSWRSQNEAAANSIAQAYATQLLIWETVIGERDANFNHVAASGCSNVKDVINAKHPLRNKIFSYYNSMVQSVQNHATIPSFCNKSSGSAKTIELEWNGSKYTTTLTDSNNVLSKYNFKASISGVSFSVNGNKLTVSMDTAPSKEFTITATKKNAVRRGVVVWSEGKHGQNSSVQDVVSYAQEVSDSINGYVKMKVSYGSCQIVKTSEDGKVDGINFTITGNGINQTVTTANGGKFQIDNLMPGIYTVTEQVYDKYEPQETHRVTVVAGQIVKVNFNNKLKRGDLQVVKSSEDNLVEGVKFHLFGTSLSGDAVDQYAVTDKDGVATFKDVLISGSEPYTLEEVDTAIRYVVPKNQTAPVKWKEVTTRNFNNILKKFTVTVTKSDAEKGEAQGNAKLSGAVYGIYKGETLVDKYVTDENGQFTTKEYVCDTDWTIREITPSEGYLLDKTTVGYFSYGDNPFKYEKGSLIDLCMNNIEKISKEHAFYWAFYYYMKHEYDQCIKMLKKRFAEYSSNGLPITEVDFLADFLVPYKDAPASVWDCIVSGIKKANVESGVMDYCVTSAKYYATKDINEQIDLLGKLCQMHPELKSPKEWLGYCYCQAGMWNNVIACLETVEATYLLAQVDLYFDLAWAHGKSFRKQVDS